MLYNHPDRPWGPPSPLKVGPAAFSTGKALATYPHLGPRLSMSRTTTPLPLCAYLAYYGMPFTFTVREKLHDVKSGHRFFLYQGRPSFLRTVPQLLLWVGSRASRVQITVSRKLLCYFLRYVHIIKLWVLAA